MVYVRPVVRDSDAARLFSLLNAVWRRRAHRCTMAASVANPIRGHGSAIIPCPFPHRVSAECRYIFLFASGTSSTRSKFNW